MPVRSAILLGLILTLGVAAPTVASACRINQPPESRIKRTFDTVVIATVVRADYTGETGPDLHPWEGSAQVIRVVAGAADAPQYLFGRSGSTAACDDGLPPPQPGETWVLYLNKANDRSGLTVNLSYPLSLVRDLDPRLANER